MTKLTKKQRAELVSALACLQQGVEFILSDHISVCRVVDRATTTLDFTRALVPPSLLSEAQAAKGAYALTEINKDIGSRLCSLYEAKRLLESFLERGED